MQTNNGRSGGFKDKIRGRPGTGTGMGTTSGKSRPFSFGLWIRLYGVDLITMALMGALGLGIYKAPPVPNRSFPVYFQDGTIVYPQYAYPLRKEVVPIFAAALIAFFAPFFFFCLFQARRRSLEDLLTTTMGLLMSLITAAVFQVWLKWLIGGLRPHFLQVCQPKVPTGGPQTGIGFGQIYYDRSVCTGDKKQINDSLESFPSGHSTAAWAGLGYLFLYFNAQLKVLSAHSPAYWKMILLVTPLLGATLISGALTIDKFHHWYDVLAGAIIGSLMALIAYRMTFASVWDFRFNHIRLPRTSSLFLRNRGGNNGMGMGGRSGAMGHPMFQYTPQQDVETDSSEMPFTREGGWGWGVTEGVNGAPFDATAAGGSMGGGMGGMGMSGARGMGMNGGGVGTTGNTGSVGRTGGANMV